jgi:membrane-associated protein
MPHFLDFFLHLDHHLQTLVADFGVWSYAILGLIVFCETGLVVTPVLPGDSLLFGAGAISHNDPLNVHTLVLILIGCALFGDNVNFFAGRIIGTRAFSNPNSRIFRRAYLERTESFYSRYGGKTIIIARFVPIVRTFAPFLAGVGHMRYPRFLAYSVAGAVLWVTAVTYAGYFFGGLEIVRKNFGLVVIGIIVVSLMPAILEILRSRSSEKN